VPSSSYFHLYTLDNSGSLLGRPSGRPPSARQASNFLCTPEHSHHSGVRASAEPIEQYFSSEPLFTPKQTALYLDPPDTLTVSRHLRCCPGYASHNVFAHTMHHMQYGAEFAKFCALRRVAHDDLSDTKRKHAMTIGYAYHVCYLAIGVSMH
jgi:hypothetical protein